MLLFERASYHIPLGFLQTKKEYIMKHYYLLWAAGLDRPGIVASVAERLLQYRCNLEDSAMMRLGSEFSMFLILTAPHVFTSQTAQELLNPLRKKFSLTIDLKKISAHEARFKPVASSLWLVTVHGPDRAGIVARVTRSLANHKFNITDLSTHRTTTGKKAGYILFIEGELPARQASRLEKALKALEKKMETHISLRPVSTQTA